MAQTRPLDECVVLVTGGTGALGSVVTQHLLGRGCTVITTYLDSEEYKELKTAVGDEADLTGYKVDVLSEEQVEDLISKVVETHGRIDVLLNLVGAWKGGNPIHETGEDTWDDMLDVNLKSVFLVSKHVLPHMRDNRFGRILSIGAKTGSELPSDGGPYAIAKRGVESLTVLLAKENASHGITANCVLPSVIDTDANREMLGTDDVEHWVTPEEIADQIISLIQNPDRTGDAVNMYGGL